MSSVTDTVLTVCKKTTVDHARVRWFDILGLKKGDLLTAARELGVVTNGTRSAVAYRIARAVA